MDRFKKIILKISKYVIGIVMLLIIGFISLFNSSLLVYAESINNVAVLDDLYADKTFNKDDYPSKNDDYGLYVLQIGESDKKELFIYVYQPSNDAIDLIGSSISISYGFSKDGKDLHPQSYDLELISTNGVFDKYYVKDFEIPNDGDRFYNIVSISRHFNPVVDKSIDLGQTNDVAYSVGQEWCCYDINNSVKYEMVTFETLEVEIVLNDTIYFPSGLKWSNFVGGFESCDAWYVAFNVNEYVINHIYDADITFDKQYVSEYWLAFDGTKTTYGDKERVTLRLTDEDTCTINNGGLFGKTYNWSRIQSSSDYISSLKSQKIDITSSSESKIEESQWVFSFVETPNTYNQTSDYSYLRTCYEISNVAILRLHFLDNTGKQYDLGVVSDKTTADSIYGGFASGVNDIKEILQDFGDFFQKFLAIAMLIVILVALCFASSLLTPVLKVLKYVLNGILYVISFPFRIIKLIFRSKK